MGDSLWISQWDSALTGKRVKGDEDSAIKEHLLFCNHAPDLEDFSILATNNNDFKVTLINRDHPPPQILSRNVGRTKMNLVASNSLYFSFTT